VKLRCEDERCEDEKMFYRPPLLEEPCAQTLSGITFKDNLILSFISFISMLLANRSPETLGV
jgi:hypothetical protein